MESNEEKTGTFALICSFLFPIIGIICYFVNKNKVNNASSYLYSALGGIVLGAVLRIATMG